MKKRDIIELIEANNVIEKHQDLLSTIQNKTYWSSSYKNEKYWFPDIKEFEEYFKVLKKELLQAQEETKKAMETIQSKECSHEVRLSYHSLFSSSNHCVLCGHTASSDNVISFKESSYRNKHTVTFVSKDQEDEDGYYKVETGKTRREVYEMILEILKNYEDEEEIDLVKEFDKLNLENVKINKEKRKQENYILIIGGTNLEYLNQEKRIFISNEIKTSSLKIFQYFISLLNTKVAVIDRKEIIEKPIFEEIEKDHSKILLQEYTTLGYLETALYQVRNIPFKLIIDLSEIYDYKIEESEIKETPHDLNLQDRFPNSQIVKIDSSTNDNDLERTCNHMKELLKK